MKTITALLLSTASSVAMACPSVDETIAVYTRGQAPSGEVAEAMLCAIESAGLEKQLCGTVVGLRRTLLHQAKELFKIGEADRAFVDAAEQSLANAESSCTQ